MHSLICRSWCDVCAAILDAIGSCWPPSPHLRILQQVLLQARRDGCWWFQEAGRCDINTLKMVVLVVCALADLLVSLYMVVLGSEESSEKSKR